MKVQEMEVWLHPVTTWVQVRAQAEGDPEGTAHKTLEAYNALWEGFRKQYPDEAEELEPHRVEIDLELGKKEQADATGEYRDATLPPVQGEHPDDRADAVGGEEGAHQVRHESLAEALSEGRGAEDDEE